MLTISKKQAGERWNSLSEALREALVSDVNSDFIWKTCEAEHIPDEKIFTISKISGAVLMGLLHPEDMANEVRDELGIDIRIAILIANAINQRIFTPLRQEIDKVYDPITKTTTVDPDFFRQTSVAIPAPVSFSSSFKITPTPTPTKPITNTPLSIPTPKPTMGPVIFRTESAPQPIKNAPEFHLPVNAENIMDLRGKTQSPAVRPAVIELGNIPTPQITTQKSGEVKVVHYGNLKTSLPAELPTASQDVKRTVTEITPQTTISAKIPMPQPKTPTPFRPIDQIPIPSPAIPKNPVLVPSTTTKQVPVPPPIPQPTPQLEKVIQKDYSEAEK